MHRARGALPSPSMAAALLALFIALGGTGYAASTLGGSAWGSRAHASAVHRKAKGLTKRQVDSLVASYFRSHLSLFRGPAGRNGVNGAPGINGAPGATNAINRVTIGTVMCSGAPCSGSATLTAPCNQGERALGGGYRKPAESGNGTLFTVNETRPDPKSGTPTDWVVSGSARGPSDETVHVPVYAMCAS